MALFGSRKGGERFLQMDIRHDPDSNDALKIRSIIKVLNALDEEFSGMMATNYAWNDAMFEVLSIIDRVRREVKGGSF